MGSLRNENRPALTLFGAADNQLDSIEDVWNHTNKVRRIVINNGDRQLCANENTGERKLSEKLTIQLSGLLPYIHLDWQVNFQWRP